MTQKGSPLLGPIDLLDQDQVWQARQDDGLVVLRVDEMKPAHLENLRAWLLRNAPRLHSMEVSALYSMTSLVQGEIALDDLDQAIGQAAQEDPRSWIRDKPLFKGITRRLAGRQ